ncbi:MAG TPA: hypothetical protein VK447_11470 [Myxococcaceae bacterium]|nr:hypothetical protein [Myxococcaceae bacterium]
MKKILGAVVCSLALVACGGVVDTGSDVTRPDGEPTTSAPGTLALTEGTNAVYGTFTRGDDVVSFRSVAVDGAFEIQAKVNGMTLDALVDAEGGVSSMDGFAAKNGADTQMVAEDRELVDGLYRALNDRFPGSELAEPAKYLRRAVGLWAQHPTTVDLKRLVMGEQGRGYTMLCSYAKCGGAWTGSCSTWNYYSYAKHDCQHGGFDYSRNQQIAQLGNHYTCSGDEYYWNGSSWVCGEPDHWSRPKVVGICWGRCGGGCGGDTQYTLDATNHDGCVRNGHALASLYCDDQFTSASDDEMFAPNCY